MLSLALAALLAALAGPALGAGRLHAIRTPSCSPYNLFSIDAILHTQVIRELGADPGQGREAAQFLSGRQFNPVRLAVAYEQREEFPRLRHLAEKDPPWAVFSLDDASILVNHAILHQGPEDEAAMIRDPRLLGLAIGRISGLVVHEVSHARDAVEPGGHFNSLETELVAFYREVFYMLDTARSAGRLHDGLRAAELELELEAGIARVHKVKAQDARAKRSPPRWIEMMDELNVLKEEYEKLPEFTAEAGETILHFSDGNEAFEAFIAKSYPMRSLICTPAGLALERARTASFRDQHAALNDQTRVLCAKPGAPDCAADLSDGDIKVAQQQRLLDDLTARELRGGICVHYRRLLTGFRKEAAARRAASPQTFEKLRRRKGLENSPRRGR